MHFLMSCSLMDEEWRFFVYTLIMKNVSATLGQDGENQGKSG